MNKFQKKIFSQNILFITKYLFSIIIALLASISGRNIGYFVIGLLELTVIFIISNQLLKLQRWLGQIFNSILVLLYNIQMLVLFFSTSFVTLIMLDNLSSWQALQGRAVGYGLGMIFLLLFSFLPILYVELQPNNDYNIFHFNIVSILLLIMIVCFEMMTVHVFSSNQSPIFSLYSLAQEKIEYEQLKVESRKKSDQLKSKFEKDEVPNFVEKPSNLKEKPNVILIFTEGFSQRIIDDSRNITPTVKEYQDKSISFTNYYNHTFATYRGIIGQLFSGYQLENLDKNYLVSLPMIFKEQGYQTDFINTEPRNKEFSNYLSTLGFENVIKSPITKGKSVSLDKEAYNELFKQAEEKNATNKPFFLSMYTFGTHVGMDSSDQKYGDGSDRVLNRFYEMDRSFKTFIEKFNRSKISDNTVLVFTTDHATFVDDEYIKAFPNKDRVQGDLDQVPFFIYYTGIEAQKIDVNGKNSINLAPTILDFLDYSSKNYFLGDSLFDSNEANNPYSTLFISGLTHRTTTDSKISDISEKDKKLLENQINNYYAISRTK